MIDEKKLIEAMDSRYKEKEGKVPDNLVEGFFQMEKLIKEQPKVGEWTPCSEKLPNEKGLYLVTRESGIVDCDRFETFLNTACFNEYGDYEKRTDKVIAWMPLPEPYKGSE